MRVLVGCEISGRVREAFRARGHEAWSCDLLPALDNSPFHLRCDVRHAIDYDAWDLALFFPPCTFICSSGLHWNKRRPERQALTDEAVEFVLSLASSWIPHKVIENPIGCLSTRWRKPDQIVQPWQFGDDASKATCLWLEKLPLLVPSQPLPGDRFTRRANQTASGQNKLGPSPERAALRAMTYPGIANAFAEQYGRLPLSFRDNSPELSE